MKVIVNSGRTVHVVDKPAVKQEGGAYSRPTVKAHGPTRRIDLPSDEAQRLIALGVVRKDEPVEAAEEPQKPGK